MEGFLLEALTFLLRWLHVVAAIAWIGESFYFVALDRGLKPAAERAQGLSGESWSVHGGGFYLKQKFMPAPALLPAELHWSKWKSYTTWLSGFALLTLTYLWSPQIHLIDPRVAALTPSLAVWLVLTLLLVGWLLYDLLCRMLDRHEFLLGLAVAVLVAGLCLLTTSLYSGRAAFLLTGAVLGTWMSANVFFVIIPGQKRIVAALKRGEAPQPRDGLRGKQRSVHNTYLTLPVVFAMLSTHYAPAYAHPHNGWLLILFLAAAALIRQFFVLWHSGRRAWGLLSAGVIVLLLALGWLAPVWRAPPVPADPPTASASVAGDEAMATSPSKPVDITQVAAILADRCGACHAAQPQLLPSAPNGSVFDTAADIQRQAAAIHQQTVVLQIMPPGNMTGMTDAERALIGRWIREGQFQ
jgi:uncharacterized membrane protein